MSTGATAGQTAFCSWSGGKDSALALYEASHHGISTRLLLTMMTENGLRSRSHGLRREVLQAQADAMGLPILFTSTSWERYESRFGSAVAEAVSKGATLGVFGDIGTDSHRRWVEDQCVLGGVTASIPLWGRNSTTAVSDFLAVGFKARIVAVRDGVLDNSFLGRLLDGDVVVALAKAGVDVAGENGEYHSVVIDGPLFHEPLSLVVGEKSLRDGVWFLDLGV